MWTPSVILFAARVLRISSMIASWVGISVNARALALETQPVEVLGELEDPPVVEAEALPHGVAALHGGVERD
jgi:hypothetical protein